MAPEAPDFEVGAPTQNQGNGATRWCGTYHNPELWFGPAGIVAKLMRSDDVDILAAQEELCPTTNRQHIQLFIKMKKKVRFSTSRTLSGFPKLFIGKWPSASAMRKPSLIASRTTPILMGL